MIFKQLEITNYGIFKGEHKINFASPSIQSVTLVGGLNGSGKTTIFEAIQIALFGAQSNLHKENKQLSYNKYLHSKINRDCKDTEGTAIRFTIDLSDDIDLNEELVITRAWKNTTKGLKEVFEVSRGNIIDIDLSENWIEFISQIISPNLSKLFLFDGEKILQYADPQNTSSLLIQGIQTLFGADLIADLEDDLKILKKRIIKSFDAEMSSNLEALDKDIAVIHKKIKTQELALDATQEALEKLNKDFTKLENKFDAYGLKKLSKAQSLESDLQALTIKKEELLKEQRAIVAGSMPLSLLSGSLQEIAFLSDKPAKLTEFENKIKAYKARDKEILNQLKKSTNAKLHKELKDYLDDSLKKISKQKPDISQNKFISSSDDHLVLNNELENESSNFDILQKELNKTLLKIEQTERSLARVPDTKDSKSMFDKRDNLIKDIAAKESQINELKQTLENDSNEEKILKNKYKKAFDLEVDKLQAESVQSKQLQRIKYTENVLEKFNNEIVIRSLNSIEKHITTKFKYLIRKDSLVENFYIDKSSYLLSGKSSSGKAIELIDLSAGERQILAISILWSLSELSRTNIPVIIDTPLGRLDSKHRHQLITKYFPEAGPQTIILSTDEEIIGDYYKTFKPYIGKQYLCSENKKESGAGIIKEGYF